MANQVFRLLYRKPGRKMPPIRNRVLLESATSLAHKIRLKELTSAEVIDIFIERIREINPLLNCVVADRFEEARTEARAADDYIKDGNRSEEELARDKPFLGVPFTTKDCIAVDGMINTSGLWRRRNIIAYEDADVVQALRAAGAIPIGLTNVSELCMWWESNNTVHGRTNNPYNTNRIAGGSSGGEGCNQAACGSAFGIGSDIGGSIRIPAFVNGVFGHKPSQFVVSIKGHYPIPASKEQDSFLGIGPLCRRSEDLVPLLKIMSQKNAHQLRLDEPVDIKKLRFYYQETDTGSPLISPVDREIRELFKKITVHLDKAHNIKTVKTNIKGFSKSRQMWVNNMKHTGANFQTQLKNLEGPINIPLELLKCCLGFGKHTFVAVLTALLENMGPGHGSSMYNKYVKERDQLRQELMDLLGDDGVLLYPTHPTPAPFHNEPILKFFNFSYTSIVNVLLLPATHVPLGLNTEGLPIGVQVIANDRCDRLCLAVARELEKAFCGWTPPEIEA